MAKPFKGTINVDLLPGQGLLAHRLVPQPFPELDFTKGQDPGEPITQDYPGEPPYQFAGGVIDRVAIDVSGDPYHDLEREAALMLMRE